MSDPAPPACGACRFADFDVSGDVMAMSCRRFPPQVSVGEHADGIGDAIQAWPSVEAHDWCGEYQPSAPDSGSEDSTEDRP